MKEVKQTRYYIDEDFNQIEPNDLEKVNTFYLITVLNYSELYEEDIVKISNNHVKDITKKELEKIKNWFNSLNRADFEYLKVVDNILTNGTKREDRTGVGTISVFGTQSRYDLSKGFPLLTTKKLSIKNIVSELIWFIKGSTDRKYLHEHNNPIWNLWDRPYSMTNREEFYFKKSDQQFKNSLNYDQKRYEDKVLEGIIDEAFLNHHDDKELVELWATELRKGVNQKEIKLSYHWQDVNNFLKEVKSLPHYHFFEKEKSFLLKPIFSEFVLSKDNAWFIPQEEFDYYKLTDNRLKPIDKDDLGPIYGHQWRDFGGVDQLKQLIKEIKENPNSRRLIVSAWNPVDIPDMALPPCHSFFQVYIEDNKLSLQLYQRSMDTPIGAPYNIASYSILIHLLALETGYEVGEFIHTTGDTHIYTNQLDMIKTQSERLPYKAPKLEIKNFKSIFEVEPEDIEIVDYQSHPFLKIPVAK